MIEENEEKREPIVARHEKRDINAKAIGCFGIVLVLCAVIVYLVMARLFTIFSEHYPSDTPPSRIAVPHTLPPQPRLQSDPEKDMEQFRAREDVALNGYEWIDRQAGHVRIPIERAMDLIAQRGLPATSKSSIGKTPIDMRQERIKEAK